jgi:hypothetical protein
VVVGPLPEPSRTYDHVAVDELLLNFDIAGSFGEPLVDKCSLRCPSCCLSGFFRSRSTIINLSFPDDAEPLVGQFLQ